MRFLTLSGSGIDSCTGTLNLGFGVSGSMSRLGEIGVGIPSVCPASMLQASNGTLLISTGLGPMLRMRYNELNLSKAGVPAPSTSINILRDIDYASEVSPTIDPFTGRPVRSVSFDFTQYGAKAPYYTWGSGGSATAFYASTPNDSPESLRSRAARNAFYALYWRQIAPISASEVIQPALNGWNINQTAIIRVGNQLQGGTRPGTDSNTWLNMTGSFLIFDDADTDIDGTYQCFQRWVDKDGYVSDPGPLSNAVSVSSRNLVKYTEVQPPDDPRIVTRQIWRNDSGQLQNFYLDIETSDLTSTEFSSTNTDAQLQLKDVITFTDVDGYTIPYLYAQPPDDKPFLAEMRGRIFAVGSRRYSFGSAQVTNGSATVSGVGTSWTTSMSGRRFIAGRLEYLIIAVDESAQELTLNVTYAGATDNFALYTIAPYAAEELIIRWSDPTAGPEAWPLTAQLLLPQDGDIITGLVNYGDALYITKTRNIYRFNFSEDPAIDGMIAPAAKRGCINHRCAVSVEGACYMLDREGIHAFTGGPNPQHITLPVADLFRESTDGYRINWNADLCFWHAILHQETSTIKWYVTLAGDMYPQHAICYDYRRVRFWIEEYPRPIAGSCYSLAVTGRPLLGTTEGKVLAADSGTLDLIEPGGTLLSIASVNSPFSVTLSEAPKDCEGVPMCIVTGAAAGVDRIVTWQDGTEIQFGTPLEIMPSKGDKLQLGGVKYHMKTASFDSTRMDGNQAIGLTIKVQPDPDAELYGQLSVYKDGGNTKANTSVARSTWGAASKYPKASIKHTQMLMADPKALIVETLDQQSETDTPINFEWQFAIDGSSGDKAPKILEIKVDGGG